MIHYVVTNVMKSDYLVYFFSIVFVVFFSCQTLDKETDSILEVDYTLIHQEAKTFCSIHQMNEQFYILVDMNIHSGLNRFFVVDLNSYDLLDQGLVTHGACDVYEPNPDKYKTPKFSNRDGSHCSSIGKYKIGKRDYSSWGIKIKYWLHGLETTNNNSVKRVVVLHSWEAVEDNEIYPNYSPLSWGCPAVSDAFMRRLDDRLKNLDKPVLLWIVKH